MPGVLICTVGGSHQPIVTAIHEVKPDFVCFVCTDRDPATENPGSVQQVIGRGTPCIVRAPGGDDRLPNIPTQAALDEAAFDHCIVPADDLDNCYAVIVERIQALEQRFPEAQMVADYTGGTKTMTAALVMAALENPRVELRLVTGTRADLVRVHDGTEAGIAVTAHRVRLNRAMAPFLQSWERYGYGAAALGLATISRPSDAGLRGELQIALDLSRAFDAWDRFDHGRALEQITLYRPRVGAFLSTHLKFLEILAGSGENSRREPARLWDLWLNAERRAAQGSYDDAVARVYRLLEWTAQWLLRAHKGWDTSDLPAAELPAEVRPTPNRDGRLQAGLFVAWDLVAKALEGPAAEFAQAERNRMLDHLSMRNQSILAHGYSPVSETHWKAFSDWVGQRLLPVLQAEARAAGLNTLPEQLPNMAFWRRE